MLSYHDFRESSRGRVIVDVAAKSVNEMEQLSRLGEPAVAAIDGVVADRLGRLGDTERQHAGRVVRDVLAPRGWRPKPVRKRLKRGQAFASGAVYAQAPRDVPFDDARTIAWADRIMARSDAAVALLASARVGNGDSVADFIAERRAEAARDEA